MSKEEQLLFLQEAFEKLGLKPVFVDIEWETLNFDLNELESKITPNTKAIFVSPVLGNPPNFDKLIEICEKYNLKLETFKQDANDRLYFVYTKL